MKNINRTALRLSVAPAVLALGLAAVPAWAQDQAPQDTAASEEADQTIVVTGTRIANPNVQSSVPVAALTNARIEQSGATNIQDVLATLPSTGQGVSRSNSNFSSTGNGTATVNLRNLGNARTLVLINGRRTVGLPGNSAVDLNNIPTELIDRVDVVTGGASAVYGSEAIAGVVNFILKKDFSGLQVHGQGTISDKGDAARQYVSVLGGFNFGGGRGNITLNASYDADHGLASANRDFSAHDKPNRSSYAAQGLFSVADPATQTPFATSNTFTFDQNNVLKGYQGANIDGYDRNQHRYLSVPVERYTVSGLGHYDLDFGTLYLEGTYVKTKSNASLEALAVDNSSSTPVLNFDGSAYAGIPITSPYVPQAIRDAAIANGVDVIQFRRRSVDIFSRSNKNDRDYWRVVAGLKGDFAQGWNYDVYYEHSQSRDHTSSGAIMARNYGAALSNEQSGNSVICSDAAARAAGCVPINIFGYNTVGIGSAAANWLQTDPGPEYGGLVKGQRVTFDYLAKVFQDVAGLSVGGELFSLFGSKPVNIAGGFEYRSERSSEVFDPYTQLGLSLGNQISNTVGKFNVKEGFVELNAPILEDRPGVHYLGLEAAARYADYSTTGGVWSYKFGGTYAPTPDIKFRAVYARATRAPNIGELFSAQSQTFPAIVDPCDQRSGEGDGGTFRALPAACANIPGVSTTVGNRGEFSYSTAQIQTIDGLLGGNRNLKTEKADTLTVGAVATPRFVRGLTLSLDYYRIKVLNAISTVGQQVSVTQCVTSGDPIFCNNVTRNAQGFITRVNDFLLNTASIEAAGLDGELHYSVPFTMLGGEQKFGVDAFWNHKFKQQRTPYPGGDIQNELGQADCYSCGRLGSGFRDRVDATFSLSSTRYRFSWNVSYMSGLSDNLDGSTATVTRIPAYWYHNAQLRFNAGESKRYEFYIGMNNVFDKKPPVFGDTNPVAWPGASTVASTYDVFGRMLYAGVTFKY